MNKKITFRGMDSSPVMEKHINEQLAKIEAFLAHERPPIKMNILVEGHPSHAHNKAEIRLSAPEYDVFITEEGPHLYKLIDSVLDRTYDSLRQQKEKRVDRNKKGCVEQCVPSRQQIDEEAEKKLLDEEIEEDLEDLSDEE
ncbi:MAG: HPF/RaiA family ribosome-associated protein [Candidatus Babeliaceae bacterium]